MGMSMAHYRVASGQTRVQLSAALDLPPPLPVTAEVSLEQRTAAGVSQVSTPISCHFDF